jgi:hypothetical protein
MMKTYTRAITSGVLALSVSLSMGCASQKKMAEQTVAMSLAIENANNQMLLLNVVRAYQRLPMHFFRVNAVKGPAGLGAFSPTIATPFGPDFRTQIYSLTTSYKPDQPAIDITPLDSQEFMRGITTPIKPSLMAYYLDQGWPKELIFYLFIREVEVTLNNGKEARLLSRYLNYPQNVAQMNAFKKLIGSLSECEVNIDEIPKLTEYGPPLALTNKTPVDEIAAAKANELKLIKIGNEYQLTKNTPTPVLRISKSDIEGAKSCAFLDDYAKLDKANQANSLAGGAAVSTNLEKAKTQEKVDDATSKTSSEKKIIFNFVLRSPEAMIYYLGEVSRFQLDRPLRNMPPQTDLATSIDIGLETYRSGERTALFQMLRNSDKPAAISVEYGGVKYSIPKDGGRSSHALSLITQLIGLQNKATDAPVTGSVRIVN